MKSHGSQHMRKTNTKVDENSRTREGHMTVCVQGPGQVFEFVVWQNLCGVDLLRSQ